MIASASLEELFEKLQSSPEGLSQSEAQKRLKEFGRNELEEDKVSFFKILLRQFKNPLNYILLAASAISISIGKTADFIVITVVVLLNILIGFIQEFKAEKSIEALKKMTEAKSRVLRNGQIEETPSSKIVPGDVVELLEGEMVTADIRLIDSEGLTVDESSITGESVPVVKHHDTEVKKEALAIEQENCLLSGTLIVRGAGRGIAVHTGKETYLASIAEKAQEESPQTPLTKAVSYFAKRYVAIQVILFATVGIVGYFQERALVDLAYILLASIVSVVPEGLPLVVTLVMAVGALKLSRKKALMRSLPAVETLGSVSILASDKTGTITQGKLNVENVFAKEEETLKKIAALCNDAQDTEKSDPLDVALAKWLEADYSRLRKENPEVWSYPFDARLRLMATANEIGGEKKLLVKGAFESLKELANNQNLAEMERSYEELLDQGLRVLAFGQGPWDGNEDPASWKIEIVGLIGFIDPPKEDVLEAVQKAKDAGIHVMMITGDHPKTALSIARQTAIAAEEDDRILTGKEVEELSDEELLDALEQTNVLARILPEHKQRVVKVLQANKESVAVTGDGVNDAPALKAANIGIAMGSGTEAAKDASDMVIADNNLSIIVEAIRNARVIADNLRKVINYLVSTSQIEMILIALSIFSKLPLPMSAIQILWINIVTDGVQDKMFAFTKEEGSVMQRKPRLAHKQFFDSGQIFRMLSFGLSMGAVTFFLYIYLLEIYDITTVTTIVFTTIVFMQWANGLQVQKEREPFFENILKSFTICPLIYLGLGVGLCLQTIPLYLLPDLFHSTPLGLRELAYPIAGFFVSFFFVEARKWAEKLFSRSTLFKVELKPKSK